MRGRRLGDNPARADASISESGTRVSSVVKSVCPFNALDHVPSALLTARASPTQAASSSDHDDSSTSWAKPAIETNSCDLVPCTAVTAKKCAPLVSVEASCSVSTSESCSATSIATVPGTKVTPDAARAVGTVVSENNANKTTEVQQIDAALELNTP